MALKLMLSKGDSFQLDAPSTIDLHSVHVEVLFTGTNRTQVAITAPAEVKITRIEAPENARRRHDH